MNLNLLWTIHSWTDAH